LVGKTRWGGTPTKNLFTTDLDSRERRNVAEHQGSHRRAGSVLLAKERRRGRGVGKDSVATLKTLNQLPDWKGSAGKSVLYDARRGDTVREHHRDVAAREGKSKRFVATKK